MNENKEMEEINKRNELLKYIYAKLAQAQFFVKERINADGKPFLLRQEAIRLQNYAESFIKKEKGASENRIIVLPGLRGVGKTTMLLQLYDFLIKKQSISQDKVLYFSTDELKDYLGASILDVINVFIEDILKTTLAMLDEKVFILIDETHFDEKWGTAAKIVYDQSKNVFLLLTGSSALNIEMSMDLARRAKKEKVFPLSFSEYLALKYGAAMDTKLSKSITTLIFNATEKNAEDAINRENELIRSTLSIGKP
ncbi:AAA family ATPase, partial [archaeon]|nr:AAA family ATPase [archaeon]